MLRRVKVSSHRNFVCTTVGAANNNNHSNSNNYNNNNNNQDSLQQQNHQHRCLGLATINPLIGLTTYLAQMVLSKPLVRAGTNEFFVDGTWSSPRVTKVD